MKQLRTFINIFARDSFLLFLLSGVANGMKHFKSWKSGKSMCLVTNYLSSYQMNVVGGILKVADIEINF